MKVLHTICQQIWKTQQWPQDWRMSVFIPIPKKGNAKDCLNYCTIALISHTSKVMLKILQARLQQYMNRELPDVHTAFRKDRGTRDHISNIDLCCRKGDLLISCKFLDLVVPKPGKGQFSFQSQRKAMPKNAQTTAQLHSSHTLLK